jgi:ketosteroid isomerase-like protein
MAMVMKRITMAIYRRGLGQVERGEFDALLRTFDRRCRFRFVGDSPLGADVSSTREIRLWFERFRRLLPDPRFEVQAAVVDGPPWRQRLASHVLIGSTVDGEPYENQFAQFLSLRWGKVTDDLVLEDTQVWDRACRRLIDAGVSDASRLPMRSSRAQA